MGYYEVRYKTSGGTSTTSGSSMSQLRSRVKDRGGTIVSSKYVSTSRKSTQAERSGLTHAEKQGMNNVTRYDEPVSTKKPDRFSDNVTNPILKSILETIENKPAEIVKQEYKTFKNQPKVFKNKKQESKTLSKQDYYQFLYDTEQEYQSVAQKYYDIGQEKTATDILDKKTTIFKERAMVEDWHPNTKIRRVKTDKGYKYEAVFPFSGADVFYSTKKNIQDRGFVGGLATAFTPSDPLGLKSAYYTATGNKEKVWETKVSAVADTRKPFHEFYLSSPMGMIGVTAATAGVGGAGIGALSAASVKAGTVAKVGLAAFGTYETAKYIAPSVSTALDTGDYGDLIGKGTNLGLALPTAFASGKIGYRAGYGRTEAFLYGRSTYKVGSPEYIRYKNTLKTVKNLQYVKSKNIKALDFTKDIMRLDSKTAKSVMGYLEQNPKSVIGGSASQYAQVSKSTWYKYRDIKPRDIDILVKDVKGAKSFIGGKSHQVDIHGYEFGGKGGKYIRFGFETQKSMKIDTNRFMRLGEQVARKGISSVTSETQYRWFKDVPDFKMASEQLISSGKKSWNPLQRFYASMGKKSYSYVIEPTTAPSFGKSPSFIDKGVSAISKKLYTPSSVGYGYSYTPSYILPYIPSFYPKSSLYSYKSTDASSYTPPSTPSYTSPVKPGTSYTPPSTPSYTSPVKPKYKPPYISRPKTNKNKIYSDDILKPKKTSSTMKLFDKKYKFRKFKVPKLGGIGI